MQKKRQIKKLQMYYNFIMFHHCDREMFYKSMVDIFSFLDEHHGFLINTNTERILLNNLKDKINNTNDLILTNMKNAFNKELQEISNNPKKLIFDENHKFKYFTEYNK